VDYPCFSFEKLGPQRTIAKGIVEGKAKSQKKAGKMQISLRRVEITAKTEGCKRFDGGLRAVAR
jgi:hypothetical protein